MLPIDGILVPATMRRALTGAAATDPTLPERRRRPRRALAGSPGPRRRRLVRTPATASESS
jgi:hypothetical protein